MKSLTLNRFVMEKKVDASFFLLAIVAMLVSLLANFFCLEE